MFSYKFSEDFPTWKKNLLLCCVFLLPLPYLFSDLVVLNYADMYMYIRKAKQMGTGNIELFVAGDRAALFPLILHLLFEVFGYSLYTLKAFHIFLLSVLCVQCWMICRVLTGNNSGIISAFFIASSFVFGHFTYFPHIDLLLTVCLSFCFLVLYKAVRTPKHQFKWIFLSGFLLGLTYSLKQTAIVLAVLLPLYLVFLERASLSRVVKLWGIQLLGLSVFLVPIAILSYPHCFGYMSGMARSIHRPGGAGPASRPLSLTRILTYYFDPVLWQWDKRLPYNVFLVRFDQIVAFLSLGLVLCWSDLEKRAKGFIFFAALIFLPGYSYVAYKGWKLRQLLFPEFMIFLTVGPLIQYLLIGKIKPRISRNNWVPLSVCLCLLLGAIFGYRMYSVNRSIKENVAKARRTHAIHERDPFRHSRSKKRLVRKRTAHRRKKVREISKITPKSRPPRRQIKATANYPRKVEPTGPFVGSGFARIVKPAVEVWPRSLDFWPILEGQVQRLMKNGSAMRRTVTIVINNGDNLKIEKVELEKSLFEVVAKEVKPGRTVQLSVEPVFEKLEKGRNTDRLKIHTNQKDYEILSVPITLVIFPDDVGFEIDRWSLKE